MVKPFKTAKFGDDISDLTCPNPRCKKQELRLSGVDYERFPGRPKILECMHCFSRYHVNDELQGLEWPGEPEKKRKPEE